MYNFEDLTKMEEDTCLTCNVCRVAYASEQELQEHNWSLMHHIKIEQTKKGAPHSCSLCMETCANVIEYGKHLNADKHKMALSRQNQGESDQMLNSLGVLPLPRSGEFLKNKEMQNLDTDRLNPKQFESVNQRLRALSQPSVFQQQEEFKHPADLGKQPFTRNEWRKRQQGYSHGKSSQWENQGAREHGEKNRRKNNRNWTEEQSQFMNHRGQGPGMEEAEFMDCQTPYMGNSQGFHRNDPRFYDDNFGFDWKDGRFYAPEMNGYADQWGEQKGYGGWGGPANYGQGFRQRRGSFDEGYSSQQSNGHRRGRGILRGRNQTRTSSYDPQRRSRSNDDRYSPESNSSTDSNGLKRRLEDGDLEAPGKSRRTNKSSGRRTPDSLYSTMDSSTSSQLEGDNSSLQGRSSRRERLDSGRRSRSHSDTSRRVTWSDQQGVSSTTDEGPQVSNTRQTKPSKPVDLVAAIPDSSTEMKKKKKKGKGVGKRGATKLTSVSGIGKITKAIEEMSDKTVGDKDSTESVLEKAEKLCKKLRNDREKVKQQKLDKEKQKKIEKQEELNTQIAELSKENLRKITGHLETAGSVPYNDTDKYFETDNSLRESKSHGSDNRPKTPTMSNVTPDMTSRVVRTPNSPMTSGDPKMAERIAQTRADIDAIRAKIEDSVNGKNSSRSGIKTPSPADGLSPLGNSKSPANNKSLLKMVNAPRTTRERLHVAQLLRNHAKSQTKYSFPRFNLKMSDLVENHSEIDEDLTEFSLESLTPSVQLEIANLIEADIKPDVAELQLLLDTASAENAELDLNILTDLGIPQTPIQPTKTNHQSPVRRRTLSADSQLNKFTSGPEGKSRVPDMGRSRSPVGTSRVNEQRREIDTADDRPSLSVEELVSEVNKAKEHMLGIREWERMENTVNSGIRSGNSSERVGNHFTASLPISNKDTGNVTRLSSSVHGNSNISDQVKVKLEQEDGGYDIAYNDKYNHTPHSITGEGPTTLNKEPVSVGPATFNRDSGMTVSSNTVPDVSKIHRSVHTRGLYPTSDDLPVRDTDRLADNSDRLTSTTSLQKESNSTVDRVNAILNAVPNMDNMLTAGQTSGWSSQTNTSGQQTNTSGQPTLPSSSNQSTLPSTHNQPSNKSVSQTVRDYSTMPTIGVKAESHSKFQTGQSAKPTTYQPASGQTSGQKSGQSAIPSSGLTTDQLLSSTTNKQGLPTAMEGQLKLEKDKKLDSSVNSNTSSVLDQVYTICIEEENVRSELTTVDAKINKLRSLISEAQVQLGSFTEKKKELTIKESQFRTSRMRLLQENRSNDSSSGSNQGLTLQGFNGPLTDAQIQNLNNPVLVKFLMSQRQSDLSSMGGYSNVESGSQPEDGQYSQRRGSITSVTSSGIGEPVTSAADAEKGNQNMLFSQSIDILTGSTDTLTSLQSGKAAGNRDGDSGIHAAGNQTIEFGISSAGNQNRYLGIPVAGNQTRDLGITGAGNQNKDPVMSSAGSQNKDLGLPAEGHKDRDSGFPVAGIPQRDSAIRAALNSGRDSGTPIPADNSRVDGSSTLQENVPAKSLSLLKTPLENFVTLEALMNGDAEIGKLIHKSLESIQRGEVKQEQEVVIKSPDVVGSVTKGPVDSVRHRRESVLSVGSDDMCISGSDTDKRAGKVSMKYMGTLHDGVNYDSLVKQMSSGGKNKPIMFTVLSSPEPVVTGKSELGINLTESPLAAAESARRDQGMNPNIIDLDLGPLRDRSPRSDTTSTLDLTEVEVHSARSNFSLGEQIKQMCDQHTGTSEQKQASVTPRSESSGEKTLEDESVIKDEEIKEILGVKDCFVKLDRLDMKSISPKPAADTSIDSNSPNRKRLKSKRERDQKSRRKQKETFILQSDTNSEDDKGSHNSRVSQTSTKSTSISEEDLVLSGSEEARTPRLSSASTRLTKKSLLDEVQLETETFSESGEDRSNKADGVNRLTIQPSSHDSGRNNLPPKPMSLEANPVEYKGPPLSVATIQVFKDVVYVCYNGSELRRFDLKTGNILRELDCSPYLVNCLHITTVEERGDILYTTGACKKLMLFNPENFSLITTYPYTERIVCLHENWGRLFVGMTDGSVGVRSLKSDKELNEFSCTAESIRCLTSSSAGMTKMLCLGTGDKVIYILDAISGLLLNMLEGHTQALSCIQIVGEIVFSGSGHNTMLVHNLSSGQLVKSMITSKPLTQIWSNGYSIYTTSLDQTIRVYDPITFKLKKLYKQKENVTFGLVSHGLLFTGHQNGMVESLPLSSVGEK